MYVIFRIISSSMRSVKKWSAILFPRVFARTRVGSPIIMSFKLDFKEKKQPFVSQPLVSLNSRLLGSAVHRVVFPIDAQRLSPVDMSSSSFEREEVSYVHR